MDERTSKKVRRKRGDALYNGGNVVRRCSRARLSGKSQMNRPPEIVIGVHRHSWLFNPQASVVRDLTVHSGAEGPLMRILFWLARWWVAVAMASVALAGWSHQGTWKLALFLLAGLLCVGVPIVLPLVLGAVLRRHLLGETGTAAPAPDVALDDPLGEPVALWRTGARLQEVLNRHWDYHIRMARSSNRAVRVLPAQRFANLWVPVLVGLVVFGGVSGLSRRRAVPAGQPQPPKVVTKSGAPKVPLLGRDFVLSPDRRLVASCVALGDTLGPIHVFTVPADRGWRVAAEGVCAVFAPDS